MTMIFGFAVILSLAKTVTAKAAIAMIVVIKSRMFLELCRDFAYCMYHGGIGTFWHYGVSAIYDLFP